MNNTDRAAWKQLEDKLDKLIEQVGRNEDAAYLARLVHGYQTKKEEEK